MLKNTEIPARSNWGKRRRDVRMAKVPRVPPVDERRVYLGVNRSRGDVLSCAFVVLTLTAAETQLTKGFSLSPAATPRHSAVASGKATDFPCTWTMNNEEGKRTSMLPTTTSAATSSPRTSGGSAAPAVLQKLGHPHTHTHTPATHHHHRLCTVWFTRIHARLFCLSLYI